MSKLYEALQEAKHQQKPSWKPTLVAPPGPETPPPPDLDPEMLVLYRSLETVYRGLDGHVILFLGAKGGEGTSTVVSNLARVAAERLHRRVAILDADTLHPTQHRLFGVSPTVGWNEVVRETEPAEDALYPTNVDRLFVVPVAPATAGTLQVVDAPALTKLLGVLKQRFDLILVDCAPAASCPESIALSRKGDGVVLVIQAESTRWPSAEKLRQQIATTGGTVVGIVFNKRQYYIPSSIYNKL